MYLKTIAFGITKLISFRFTSTEPQDVLNRAYELYPPGAVIIEHNNKDVGKSKGA
jgi:hypothetical protein